MRIPIREQFSLLVLVVSLNALMVLALAVVRLNQSLTSMAELFAHTSPVVPKSQLHRWRWVRWRGLEILFRGHALTLSQAIRPDLNGLTESSRAFCNTFTVPVPGAVHLDTYPRPVRSHRME
jgi:nitric oxide reductase large subunit